MRNDVSVAIIGGGIGGLAAALSLRAAGLDAHVYERSSEFGEIGAGIQISPNASRILHKLGLGEGLERISVKPVAWHQRRWDDGRTLLRSPLAGVVENAFGYPHCNVHRADLIDLLRQALPQDRIHTSHRLVSFVDHEGHIEAGFDNGHRIQTDALIGADGIHSEVRHGLFGPEKPHFTGCVAYRGIVPAERLAHLDLELTAQVWMGPGKHFVHYFVRRGALVSFVAILDQDDWTKESWTDRGSVELALRAYDGWHPQVHDIIRSVDEIFVWALLDRPPMPQWSKGRVGLLGDSCHAMLPLMAQGAVQSIEDGATLAACLSRASRNDVPLALQHYQTLRLPRTSKIQGMSATNKIRFHLPDGPDQVKRDAEMANGATDWSLGAVSWIYGYDASQPHRQPAT